MTFSAEKIPAFLTLNIPGVFLGAFDPSCRNVSLQNQTVKGPNMVPAVRTSKQIEAILGIADLRAPQGP